MTTRRKRTPLWRSHGAAKNSKPDACFYQFPDETTPSQRLVYLVFAANTDKNGEAVVPRSEIALATGLSEATIGTVVLDLERKGLIERAGREGYITKHAVRKLPMARIGAGSEVRVKKSASKEEKLLGGMLIGGRLMPKEEFQRLFEWLGADDFENEACGIIFGVMSSLNGGLGGFLPEDVASELLSIGLLEKVGGAEYLAHLIDCSPLSFRPAELASSIFEEAIRRKAGFGGGRLV